MQILTGGIVRMVKVPELGILNFGVCISLLSILRSGDVKVHRYSRVRKAVVHGAN